MLTLPPAGQGVAAARAQGRAAQRSSSKKPRRQSIIIIPRLRAPAERGVLCVCAAKAWLGRAIGLHTTLLPACASPLFEQTRPRCLTTQTGARRLGQLLQPPGCLFLSLMKVGNVAPPLAKFPARFGIIELTSKK